MNGLTPVPGRRRLHGADTFDCQRSRFGGTGIVLQARPARVRVSDRQAAVPQCPSRAPVRRAPRARSSDPSVLRLPSQRRALPSCGSYRAWCPMRKHRLDDVPIRTRRPISVPSERSACSSLPPRTSIDSEVPRTAMASASSAPAAFAAKSRAWVSSESETVIQMAFGWFED